jgi:MFS family permease
LIVTLPSLSMAVMAPLAGHIIDRFGRRRLILGGIIAYAMAGYRNAFNNFGSVVYLLLGGFLAALDWRAPFLIYLSAFALLPFAWRHLYEPSPGHQAPRPTADGSQELPKVPWIAIGGNYLAAILFGLSFYMIPTQLPFHLDALGFRDPSVAGLGIAVSTLTTGITSLFYGTIRRFLGTSSMFVYGFALAAIGFARVALTDDLVAMFSGLALFGVGMGSITANFSIRLLEITPVHVRGRVMGGQNASIMMGFFLSPFLSQTVAGDASIPVAFGVASGLLTAVMLGFAAAALGARRTALKSLAGSGNSPAARRP